MTILAFEASWTWVAFLFGLGIVLAVAEILIPSHGVLTLLSVGSFLAAIIIAFLMGQTAGFLTLVGALLLTPLLIYILVRVWPHTPVARRLILSGPSGLAKAGDLAHLDPKALVGRIGVAKTLLRPSGKMTLDGRLVDCITQGDLVPAGRKVRVLAVEGAKVVVRAVEETDEA